MQHHQKCNVKVVRCSPYAKLPTKGSVHAAAFDLAIAGPGKNWETVMFWNHVSRLPTGLKFEIPEGWFGLIVARSSTRTRWKLEVATSKIDSDYRGEVFLSVRSIDDSVVVPNGTRLAQISFHPVHDVTITEVVEAQLSFTVRGNGGFGSTGV